MEGTVGRWRRGENLGVGDGKESWTTHTDAHTSTGVEEGPVPGLECTLPPHSPFLPPTVSLIYFIRWVGQRKVPNPGQDSLQLGPPDRE